MNLLSVSRLANAAGCPFESNKTPNNKKSQFQFATRTGADRVATSNGLTDNRATINASVQNLSSTIDLNIIILVLIAVGHQ